MEFTSTCHASPSDGSQPLLSARVSRNLSRWHTSDLAYYKIMVDKLMAASCQIEEDCGLLLTQNDGPFVLRAVT